MEHQPPSSKTPDSFFDGDEQARHVYGAVLEVVMGLGEMNVRVGKSQVAFRHRRVFAAVWMPGHYLRGRTAPLVLTVYLPFRDPSPRWKQIVEPSEGHFTHHLELWHSADVDDEVTRWLRQAWEAAA